MQAITDVLAQPHVFPRRENKDILLCLSGGGYRAAAFHLGVLRRLHELDLFKRLTSIRSVSGGSILAAHLAATELRKGVGIEQMDFEADLAARFRQLLRKDIRTVAIAATFPFNWWWKTPRLRIVESLVRRHIIDAPLAELPQRYCFVATDLHSGTNVELEAGSKPWNVVGAKFYADAIEGSSVESDLDPATWPAARAVVASAAFPPVFGPLIVRNRVQPPTGPGRDWNWDLALSDGGVSGNIGAPILNEGYVHTVISDASYVRGFWEPGWKPRPWFLRALQVSMSQGDQRTLAGANRPEQRTTALGISDSPLQESADEAYGELVNLVAKVRTDLDRFTDAEIHILENRGYLVASSQIPNPWFEVPISEPARAPHPDWLDKHRMRQSLCGSNRRLIKARLLSRLLLWLNVKLGLEERY